MRMRRKHNLEARFEACKKYLIETNDEPVSFIEAEKNPCYIDYQSQFNNGNPVEIEIGCGMGGFITECARRNPDINYLGVERISSVLITALERAEKEKINNLKFLRTNAACLKRYIPDHSIDRIYLNFSNPLPKSVNTRQRLTSELFIKIYKSILIEKGSIFLKTDNKQFFEFSMEELTKNGFILENISYDLHKSEMLDNIVTEHEKKFSEMGLPIYRFEAYYK